LVKDRVFDVGKDYIELYKKIGVNMHKENRQRLLWARIKREVSVAEVLAMCFIVTPDVELR
jgi:hypothetical protein